MYSFWCNETVRVYRNRSCWKTCGSCRAQSYCWKANGTTTTSKDATVTYTHSKTKDLPSITKQADILIAAVGRPNFITKEHIKEGAVVIDVGINRDENNKLIGDVNYSDVDGTASYITPVPGGVGPMTITMLLFNTVQSAEKALTKAQAK